MAPGSVDTSFGTGGIATVFGFNNDETVGGGGIAIDSALRIVVVGGFSSGSRSCVVARFLPDGSLDGTFGTGGVVRQGVEEQVCWYAQVALQADGKIVTIGVINGHAEARAIVARYLTDGTLDPLFGDAGLVVFDQDSITYGLDVAIDSNQRIVAVGHDEDAASASFTFFTRRYLPDGTIDSTFGDGGAAEVPFRNGADGASAVTILPDGRIVVVGQAGSESSSDFAMVRYMDDGVRDTSFGVMGSVTSTFDTYAGATGVVLDATGRSVVVGTSKDTSTNQHRGILMRLTTTDGALDSSLGGGLGTVSQPQVSFHDTKMTLQNMILAAGTKSTKSLALARYMDDGNLDSTFGVGGFAHDLPLTGFLIQGVDIAIQPDGRIVVGGAYDGREILVARYCP